MSEYEDHYDYRDMNGDNRYVEVPIDILTTARGLTDEQVKNLLSVGAATVKAFSDTDLGLYFGITVSNGIPVIGVSSYVLHIADITGRGTFLDDFMYDEAPYHPLLENKGWYHNPVMWAMAATTVRDLIGIDSLWGPDQYTFLTMPWEIVVGPIPTLILPEEKELILPELEVPYAGVY